MKKNKLAITTVVLGVAFLLRNSKSREKLKSQFQDFMMPSKRNKEVEA